MLYIIRFKMADPLLPAMYIIDSLPEAEEEIDPELLAEFQREIERHQQVRK